MNCPSASLREKIVESLRANGIDYVSELDKPRESRDRRKLLRRRKSRRLAKNGMIRVRRIGLCAARRAVGVDRVDAIPLMAVVAVDAVDGARELARQHNSC